MCVDRLEVGLKPACVSACLGNALDFGVIENTPERRDQNKTQIPGFPTRRSVTLISAFPCRAPCSMFLRAPTMRR